VIILTNSRSTVSLLKAKSTLRQFSAFKGVLYLGEMLKESGRTDLGIDLNEEFETEDIYRAVMKKGWRKKGDRSPDCSIIAKFTQDLIRKSKVELGQLSVQSMCDIKTYPVTLRTDQNKTVKELEIFSSYNPSATVLVQLPYYIDVVDVEDDGDDANVDVKDDGNCDNVDNVVFKEKKTRELETGRLEKTRSWGCEICGTAKMNSQIVYDSHCNGKKHKIKMKELKLTSAKVPKQKVKAEKGETNSNPGRSRNTKSSSATRYSAEPDSEYLKRIKSAIRVKESIPRDPVLSLDNSKKTSKMLNVQCTSEKRVARNKENQFTLAIVSTGTPAGGTIKFYPVSKLARCLTGNKENIYRLTPGSNFWRFSVQIKGPVLLLKGEHIGVCEVIHQGDQKADSRNSTRLPPVSDLSTSSTTSTQGKSKAEMKQDLSRIVSTIKATHSRRNPPPNQSILCARKSPINPRESLGSKASSASPPQSFNVLVTQSCTLYREARTYHNIVAELQGTNKKELPEMTGHTVEFRPKYLGVLDFFDLSDGGTGPMEYIIYQGRYIIIFFSYTGPANQLTLSRGQTLGSCQIRVGSVRRVERSGRRVPVPLLLHQPYLQLSAPGVYHGVMLSGLTDFGDAARFQLTYPGLVFCETGSQYLEGLVMTSDGCFSINLCCKTPTRNGAPCRWPFTPTAVSGGTCMGYIEFITKEEYVKGQLKLLPN